MVILIVEDILVIVIVVEVKEEKDLDEVDGKYWFFLVLNLYFMFI